jgi:hypothetical protein
VLQEITILLIKENILYAQNVEPLSLRKADDMDIQALSALVVQKFKEAGGYSELEDKVLFESIFKFLDMQYRRHTYIAQQKIKEDERRGIFPNKAKYDAAYIAVEDIVMAYANKLAATDRADV